MSVLTNIQRAAFSTCANGHKISFKTICHNCPLFYTQMDAVFCYGCPFMKEEQEKAKKKDNIIHREALKNWQKVKEKKNFD